MNRPYRSSSRTFRTSPVSHVSETPQFHYLLQNAPFRSQIFKIVFASGGKGAMTPKPKSCGRSWIWVDPQAQFFRVTRWLEQNYGKAEK